MGPSCRRLAQCRSQAPAAHRTALGVFDGRAGAGGRRAYPSRSAVSQRWGSSGQLQNLRSSGGLSTRLSMLSPSWLSEGPRASRRPSRRTKNARASPSLERGSGPSGFAGAQPRASPRGVTEGRGGLRAAETSAGRWMASLGPEGLGPSPARRGRADAFALWATRTQVLDSLWREADEKPTEEEGAPWGRPVFPDPQGIRSSTRQGLRVGPHLRR